MYRCDPDQSDKVTREKVADLTCEHVEADTRMIWHLKYISDISNNVNAIVRSNDTDVLVILLYRGYHYIFGWRLVCAQITAEDS